MKIDHINTVKAQSDYSIYSFKQSQNLRKNMFRNEPSESKLDHELSFNITSGSTMEERPEINPVQQVPKPQIKKEKLK